MPVGNAGPVCVNVCACSWAVCVCVCMTVRVCVLHECVCACRACMRVCDCVCAQVATHPACRSLDSHVCEGALPRVWPGQPLLHNLIQLVTAVGVEGQLATAQAAAGGWARTP